MMLAFVAVSCSKSDEESVKYSDSFYEINGINPNDYSWVDYSLDHSPNVNYIYSGFRNNTDELYVWFCDEDKKVISKTIINLPKQINEDQGYGNIVACEREDGFIGVKYIKDVDNFDFFIINPRYDKMKNNFSYLLIYNNKKLYSYKLEKGLDENSNILKWHKDSYLLGTGRHNYFYCLTDIGGKISLLEDNEKTNFRLALSDISCAIPLNYTECIILQYSKINNKDLGFLVLVESIDKGEEIIFNIPSPFNSSENHIIDSASLLETKDNYYIVECHLTAYNGEKKTVKIKIDLNEKKAEIIN